MPVDWRKSPKSVSLADIEKTSDDELWQIIFLALVPRVSGTMDEQYEIVKSWSAGLQMLWATQLVEDEVNNGGFNQYFFNRSGQWAEEAIDGFRLIGRNDRAAVVQAAINQFFADAPKLRKFYREHTMEAFMESYKHTDLGQFDQKWYSLPDFFAERTAYIRKHPEEFVLTAEPQSPT